MRVFRIFKLGRYTVGGELLQVVSLYCVFVYLCVMFQYGVGMN